MRPMVRELEEGLDQRGAFVGLKWAGFLPNAYDSRVLGGVGRLGSPEGDQLWGAERDEMVVVAAMAAAARLFRRR